MDRSRPESKHRPLILGLAGGVGAGKSVVAACLEKLGCVVIDSDARAKAKLDDPEARARIVQWWGEDILDESGRVDRAKVAAIVFQNDAERARLEQLIHPMLVEDREATIAQAAAAGAPAVVIDAPLLFEAGLNEQCDYVIFIEAPHSERVARVAQSRGWGESELIRREKAQMPLEKKRRLADYTVTNTGSTDELCDEVSRVFRGILGKSPR